MPNLKDLKVRINSVKSTQKITSAMKMVAAAKLRRAQESAEAARPYAEKMERMVADVGESIGGIEDAPPLLVGTGSTQIHLIVACTADRGLCGGFNGTIIREVRTMAHNLKRDGKIVRILCVGRKGRDGLKRQFEADIVETIEGIGTPDDLDPMQAAFVDIGRGRNAVLYSGEVDWEAAAAASAASASAM